MNLLREGVEISPNGAIFLGFPGDNNYIIIHLWSFTLSIIGHNNLIIYVINYWSQ